MIHLQAKKTESNLDFGMSCTQVTVPNNSQTVHNNFQTVPNKSQTVPNNSQKVPNSSQTTVDNTKTTLKNMHRNINSNDATSSGKSTDTSTSSSESATYTNRFSRSKVEYRKKKSKEALQNEIDSLLVKTLTADDGEKKCNKCEEKDTDEIFCLSLVDTLKI